MKHRKTAKRVQGILSRKNLVVFVAVFAAIGVIRLLLVNAATNQVAFEPEGGTVVSPAAKINDANASGGQAIVFNAPPVGGGDDEPILPAVSGTCPTLRNGQVQFPSDQNRVVHLRMDSNAATKGPLIFLWHGQQTPDTTDAHATTVANTLLTNAVVTQVINAGGIVAIMKMHSPSTWDNATSWNPSTRDLNLADQVVACANQQGQLDPKRIHSVGMSWGGYMTSHFAYLRSNYIASAVVQSGGFTGSAQNVQRPSNKFATITGIGQVSAGELQLVVNPLNGYRNYAKSNGQFVVHCAHSGGHVPIPGGGPMHWRFFQDHPYGVTNAYGSSALPSAFLNSCSKY